MGQISHPTLGSPHAMVTPWAELVTVGSRSLDKTTFATTSIEYPHHEIHEGNHYAIRAFDTIDSGGTIIFGVTTPNTTKWSHMYFQIEGNNQTEVRMWEGTTLSGATIVTPTNSNRNSSNVSSLTIIKNPVISGTVPTSGTIIETNSKGLAGTTPAKASFGGAITREDEWILKSGTTYMWEIKSAAASNTIDYNGYWYENINKE